MTSTPAQSDFDAAIESYIELGLDPDDALQSAREEFISRGLSLNLIAADHASLEMLRALRLRLAELLLPLSPSDAEFLVRACAACSPAASLVVESVPGLVESLLAHLDDEARAVELLTLVVSPQVAKPSNLPLLVQHLSKQADASSTLQCILACMTRDEMAKRALFSHGLLDEVHAILTSSTAPASARELACKVTRLVFSDDDHRPGLHPETFARARSVGEFDSPDSLLVCLVSQLERAVQAGDDSLCECACSALKALCVNDFICRLAADKGLVDLGLGALRNRQPVQAVALLRYLARNDEVKRTLGMGAGIEAICDVGRAKVSPELAREIAACLGVVCLRQPAICDRLVLELDAGAMLLRLLKEHELAPEVTRAVLVAVRNLVSHVSNAPLIPVFIELGADRAARAAAKRHGEACREVARDCLRDFKLKFEDV